MQRSIIFTFLSFVSCFIAISLHAGERPGIQKEKPDSGRFVETPDGYMVPYKVTIPGTTIQFDMMPIPGGTFKMGSPESEEDREDYEGPQVEVQLKPFWMAKCEVTWAEYKSFMYCYDVVKKFESRKIRVVNEKNITDTVTVPTPLYDSSFTYILGEEDNQPAVTVSHYAAKQYSKWLSLQVGTVYRLPTEAEWEYACRAGTTTRFSFGDDASKLGEYAWYFENAEESYQAVGQLKPNPWGLHDMHGNVAELCLDQFAEETYKKLAGKPVTSDQATVWTKEMFPHVIRGGSWDSDPDELRCATRLMTEDWREKDPNFPKSPWWYTDDPALMVGFRLIRPLAEPSKEECKKFWDEDSELLQMAVDNRLEGGRGVRAFIDEDLSKSASALED